MTSFQMTVAHHICVSLSGLTQLKKAKCKSSELGTCLTCLGITRSVVVRADQTGSWLGV